MQNFKESLRAASRKYAGVKEDADLEEEIYFNPHKLAQMQAYEAGFKTALTILNGVIENTIKEISK